MRGDAVRKLRLVTIVVLGVLAVDIVGFIIGFGTCGDDGNGCANAHLWFNSISAYLGIALACAAAILVLAVFIDAVARRRRSP